MKHRITPQVRRGIVKWIVQAALGLVAYGLILFLTAGRVDWIWGWAQLIILAAFMAAHPLLLIPMVWVHLILLNIARRMWQYQTLEYRIYHRFAY